MQEEKENQSSEVPEEEDFAKLFEQQAQERAGQEDGPVLFGRVICRQDDYYLMDIGIKSEGRIPADSIPQGLELAPGMRLPVIKSGSPTEGFGPMLSLRGAVRQLQWRTLQAGSQEDAVIEAQIFRPKGGGFFVGLFIDPQMSEKIAGVPRQFWQAYPYPAEMPLGEVDTGDPRPLHRWVGRKIQVKILELRSDGVVVVSRRKLALERREAERELSWSRVQVGDVGPAKVKAVERMGALVDIEGIEGALPSAEVSWYPNPDIKRHLRQGETIDVKILKKDESKRRFLVSRRALLPHPADDLKKNYKKGMAVEGVVSKMLANGGCFVRLPNSKREAFIPAGEMSQDTPLQEGASIKTLVLRVDQESIRLVLSPRKYEEKQMPEIMARYTQESHNFSLGELLSPDDESSESEES